MIDKPVKILTGRLEDWWYEPSIQVFRGRLYDDILKRWHDGALIHTSHCPFPDAKQGDIIETLNSRYLLGEPWDDYQKSNP